MFIIIIIIIIIGSHTIMVYYMTSVGKAIHHDASLLLIGRMNKLIERMWKETILAQS
jgi:hypothetical protein